MFFDTGLQFLTTTEADAQGTNTYSDQITAPNLKYAFLIPDQE
jgi:hypothetical protein